MVKISDLVYNRIDYRRTTGIIERYRSRTNGVQQSFIVDALSGDTGDLVIAGVFDTPLIPKYLSDEDGVAFYEQGAAPEVMAMSKGILRYTGAIVQDAKGHEMFADLILEGYEVRLRVPEGWLNKAAFPIVIDPMIGDPVLVSDPRAMQDETAIAYNPDDNEYLVVWGGYDTGNASRDLEGQRIAVDGTLIGNLIVIAEADGDQTLPAVTYNPAQGEYLVVWTDYRNDADGDIYGQRVSAGGTLTGQNFPIREGEEAERSPDVAYNATDDAYLVVWEENEGWEVRVYGQQVTAAGILSGIAFVVSNQGGETEDPQVVFNAQAGEYLVIWTYIPDWAIYGQWVSRSGVLLDHPATTDDESDSTIAFLISDAADKQTQPAVAMDTSRGQYLVIWRDLRADTDGDIYGQRIAANKNLSGSAFAVSAAQSWQKDPALVYNAGQDIYLALWRDYRNSGPELYAQFILPDGTLSGSNLALYQDGVVEDSPNLAANGQTGEYLAIWRNWGDYTINAYGGRLNSSGQMVGGAFPVAPVAERKKYPDMAFNESSREYLLVWEDYRDGDADIYAQRVNESGEKVGENFRVSDLSAGGDQSKPRVAALGSDGYLVVWGDERGGSSGDIYAQRLSGTGAVVGSNVLISNASRAEWEPVVAGNSDDEEYLVVWHENTTVRGQLLDATGVLSGTAFTVSGQGWSVSEVVYNPQVNEYLVVWPSWGGESTRTNIYAQRLSSAGNLLDHPGTAADESQVDVPFVVSESAGDQYYPSLAVDAATGTYLITWLDMRDYGNTMDDVYGALLDSSGDLLGAEFAVSNGPDMELYPVTAALGGGYGFLTGWSDSRDPWDIYGQRILADGAFAGENELLVDGAYLNAEGAAQAGPVDSPWLLLAVDTTGDIYAQRYHILAADFEADVQQGGTPLTVTFANQSTPADLITDYLWDFGDGNTSTLTDPAHTYEMPGLYTVTLQAGDGTTSHTMTKTAYIEALEPGDGILLVDDDGAGTYESYYTASLDALGLDYDVWTVDTQGDVPAATLAQYDLVIWFAGYEYENTLTAGDQTNLAAYLDGGGKLFLTGQDIGWDINTTSFYADYLHASFVQDDTNIYDLTGYSFLDGVTINISGGDGADNQEYPSEIGVEPGATGLFDYDGSPTWGGLHWENRLVYLSFGFEAINSAASRNEVMEAVLDWLLPADEDGVTADFSASPLIGMAPLTATFVNSTTGATDYLWNFGDGITSTTISPTHVYTQVGVYTVSLTATGNGGSDVLTRTNYITVSQTVEPVEVGFSAAPLIGTVPLTVTFANSSTGATDYLWDFGDGITSTVISPTHIYTQAGIYTVSLAAAGVGGSDVLTQTDYISVFEPVKVEFGATPLTGTAPLTVTFVNSTTGATDYLWDFGDGITATVISPTHIYTQVGVYTVSLAASGRGGSDILTHTGYISVTGTTPITRAWQLITTTVTVPVIGEQAMAYDGGREVVVLYGGNADGWPYEDTTWEFDGTDWITVTTTQNPEARYGAAMGYDPVSQTMVLFGGSNSDDTALNQTWVYTAGEWIDAAPATAPLSRTNAAMAAGPATGAMYLFGGNDGETYFNDLWKYAAGNWQTVPVSGTVPAARTLAATAWNSADDTLLLFGGRSVTGDPLADLWAFDPVSSEWLELDDGGGGGGPSARMAHSLTYDPDAGDLILVGGAADGDTLLADTWRYRGGWAEVADTALPPEAYHRMVYDSTAHALILVGNGEVGLYE